MALDEIVVYPKRRMSVERVLYISIIGGLLFIVYRLAFPMHVAVVLVNGKSVAVVANERTAQNLLDMLRKQYFLEQPQLVTFRQQVIIHPIEARGTRVMAWDEARRELARALTPAVRVFTIYVNDKPWVALPTEADAQRCLERVQRHYVPRGARLISAQFKETVRVKPVLTTAQRARAALKTLTEAVEVLTRPVQEATSYVVQPGDTFIGIARRFGVTLTDLQFYNPGVDVYRLRVGDHITIAGGNPPLTVITRVEETRIVDATAPWTVRMKTPALPRGTIKVVQEGRPAKQRVRLRITYINGKEQVRRASYEEIVQEAVPRKVLVGTG
ncbi:MAG: G5 domain-containing protein [Abditibacteriales bacterium]|nr:G5 domain-containing protein [Abditibacteriales bacterium]MDW8365622.1 G5 domain-containing protein [Abditibacteriales bacterium]